MLGKIVKKACKSVVKCAFVAVMCVGSLEFVIGPAYSYGISESKSGIQKYAPYTQPLRDQLGANYCSSSVISYKGRTFTVTNNHCCDYGLTLFGHDEIRVGDVIEKIIHQSAKHDVCVLTSYRRKSPIRLANREFKKLEKVLVMGYPRGGFLTPRWGHYIAQDIEICIPGPMGMDCKLSNFVLAITYGGNSGSPVFNMRGELVNLIYAGNMYIHTFGVTVPFRHVKDAISKAYDKTN